MRRYLRVYAFDADGGMIAGRRGSLSQALMPSVQLPGMKLPAWQLACAEPDTRRTAAVDLLVRALKRRVHRTYGVAVVCCPERRMAAFNDRAAGRPVSLTDTNAYLGSFASVGPSNTIWAGDCRRETLDEMVEHLAECMRHVRTEHVHRAGMFTAVN